MHTARIVTMLYDDIAHAPENPMQGKLFNKPGRWESCLLQGSKSMLCVCVRAHTCMRVSAHACKL